jgi:hypothetical protein
MNGSIAFILLVVAAAAALAIWAYTRISTRRPSSVKVALLHVALGYVAIHLMPLGAHAGMAIFPRDVGIGFGLAFVTTPAVTYLFLSWLWLLGCVRDALPSKPKGGHPVLARTP